MKFLLSITIGIFLLSPVNSVWAISEINIYFPPNWKEMPAADQIADGLSQTVGIKFTPHIADCYPEIFTALSQKKPVLAYVGSMVSAIIWSREIGTPLFQAIDHKQFYGGVLLFPKGSDPETILSDYPAEVAYTAGATSGEVCALVATNGKASLAVAEHRVGADSIMNGTAKAAFVKNFWWAENKDKYPALESYNVPGVSDLKNADNVLIASSFVPPEIKTLIMSGADNIAQTFNADLIAPFDSSSFNFTLDLMKKAGINPLTYTWPTPDSGPCVMSIAAGPTPKPNSQPKTKSVDGERILENRCGECHLVEKVRKYRRKTKEQWEMTIAHKIDMGVDLTKEEQAALLDYLVSLYPKKKN